MKRRIIAASTPVEPANDFNLEEHMKFNDKYFPRVDIQDKSRYQYYRYKGHDFAYDRKDNLVIQLFKDQDEKDALGQAAPYRELSAVGLRAENWRAVSTRNEYLDEWIAEQDLEAEQLTHDFIRNELPYYQNKKGTVEGAYDTGVHSYDPVLDKIDADDIATVTFGGKQYEVHSWEDGYTVIAPADADGLHLWAQNRRDDLNTFWIYRSDNDGKHLEKMSGVSNFMKVIKRISEGVPAAPAGFDMQEFESKGRCKVDYNRVSYTVQRGQDNTIWISSSHPYDLTEYHYAYKKDGATTFRICRDRKLVDTVKDTGDFLDVIKIMDTLDSKLSSRIDHT